MCSAQRANRVRRHQNILMIPIDIRLQVSGLIQVNRVKFNVVFVHLVVKIVPGSLILGLVGFVRRSLCVAASTPGAYGQNSGIVEG